MIHDVLCCANNGPPKKFPNFYATPIFRYLVHKILPADHILSQINPILTLIPNVNMNHFTRWFKYDGD